MAAGAGVSVSYAKQMRLLMARNPDFGPQFADGTLTIEAAKRIDRGRRGKTARTQLTITVPDHMAERIRAIAREQGCSLGTVVTALCEIALDEDGHTMSGDDS